jgi:hypothetical protein
MSDPRFTDPRNTDPRLSDPVLRQEEPAGGIWGWVAGLAVLALIAFIVVAGWNSDQATTANSNSPPVTTGANAPATAPRNVNPPSTTGSGASSPSMPSAPSPSTPAQSPNGGR